MVRFDKDKARPRRVIVRSQVLTKKLLERTFWLMGDEEFKDVYIEMSLNEKRPKFKKKLQREARERNENWRKEKLFGVMQNTVLMWLKRGRNEK